MRCARCEGLMVEEHLFDVQNPSGEVWIGGWRCVNCGEIVEATIMHNRQAVGRTAGRETAYRAA